MEGKDIGKVVCVETHDKKKVRDNWLPCLVVAPTLQSSVRANVVEDYLVRSFKDGKYYAVPKKDITEFTKEIGARVENPTLKTAVEKALLFLDKDELPPHWDRNLLFGVGKICIPTDNKAVDSDNSDKESIEEKDHFVAQLFKFMDDRGTPLNQAPVINGIDVDLYKLFKVVNNYGGCNKVNTGKLWKLVANKAGYKPQSYLRIQHCYTQYLHSFEDFYQKLGSTMWSHSRGVRSSSKFSRSIIRDVNKVFPSTSSATDKNKNLTNIHLRSESRRASILSDLADSASVLQPTLPGLLIENLGKIKKKDVTEKKKTLRKKKDDKEEKVSSNGTISTSINIENVPFDKDSSVVVGDNLVVYYGDITYDAKVINVCDIERVMKYYVHYEGWNVRYDEWIDDMRIAYKKKEQEPEEDIDADSSKSSIEDEVNFSDLKYEVLDLSMNPRKSPHTNIFSI